MAADINALTRRYEALRTERRGWDAAWKTLAELFLPCRWRSDTDETAHQSPKLNSRLVNSAGVLALRTLAAGMQGGMTSPVRPWFRLTAKGADADRVPGLRAWLEEATARMQRVLHESNFYNAAHGLYGDLGTFGTGLLIETADEDGVHFHLARAGEYVLDINGRNEVDTFFRRRLWISGEKARSRNPSDRARKKKTGRAGLRALRSSTACSRAKTMRDRAASDRKASRSRPCTGCMTHAPGAAGRSCPKADTTLSRRLRRAGASTARMCTAAPRPWT